MSSKKRYTGTRLHIWTDESHPPDKACKLCGLKGITYKKHDYCSFCWDFTKGLHRKIEKLIEDETTKYLEAVRA